MSSKVVINGKKYGKYQNDGITTIYYDDLYHSLNDEPAFIMDDGSIIEWYRYGKKHRDNDKPAVIMKKSVIKDEWAVDDENYFEEENENSLIYIWYLEGVIHRDGDKPARIEEDCQEWYIYGRLHRDNGQPAIIHKNGNKEWYKDGKLHSYQIKSTLEYTPAISNNDGTYVAYYKNGVLHRDDDKPALINNDMMHWYKNGVLYHTIKK